MPDKTKKRSAALKRYQGEIQQVAGQANAAFAKAEDSLTALEDRHARRAGRTSGAEAKIAALRDRMG